MGKLRVSDGIDLHYGGIQEGGAGLTDGSRNLTIATGASAGKFAVMSSSVHGSYDFYNNGTSYFNGSVVVDESFNVTGSGRAIKMNGTTRINSDGHFITAGNLYFGATDSSLLAKDTANIRYLADGQHKFETYSGGWGRRVDIDDSGLNIVSGHAIRHNTTTVLNSSRYIGNVVRNYLSNNFTGTYIHGSGDYLQIKTAYGYTNIGSANGTYSHFYTDRSKYYFNKGIHVDTGVVRSHDEDLQLQRAGTTGIKITSSSVIIGDVPENDDFSTVELTTMAGNGRLVVGDGEIFMYGNQNSNAEFKFTSNGILHCDNDVIAFSSTISSDRKLKENIQPIEGGLNKILKLKGVSFDWKDEKKGNNQLGFIAQDVEEVLPELVKEVETLGTEDESHKVVNYDGVIPVLVEAIKMQQEQIDRLTSLINEKGE